MPRLGVVLAVTNPLSSGYLAPFAAVAAWARIADKILIIDGGTTDNSLVVFRNMFNNKIEIISNEVTHWGKGDNWNLLQLGVNLNYGMQLLDTEWAYVFSSDYVPFNWKREHILKALNEYSDSYWIKTHVGKPINGKIHHRFNNRNVIFNLKKIRHENQKILYGLNDSGPSDGPIVAKEVAYFVDPVNKSKKAVYRGESSPSTGIVDFECIAYGHFFYNMKQVEYKIERWDRAISRFEGYAPSRLQYLKFHHGIHSIVGHAEKGVVMGWDHPLEAKDIIREYYEQGMIGGIKQDITSVKRGMIRSAMLFFRIERKLRTLYWRLLGKVGPERDALVWQKI